MVLAQEDLPQCEFLVALYEYPAPTFFLRGISLPAAHMHVGFVPAALARRRFAASAYPTVCAHLLCAGTAISRLVVYRIQMDDLAATPEQVLLRYLLPLAEQKHAVQSLVVLGLAYAAAFPIQGAVVYHLRGNGAFPVSVVAHFPVAEHLVRQDIPAALLV